ncbi:uncharacterized protein [Nicotiana tomentosiformis]|uniref:uncharacterized protein n=1 Tax=Nicotiana tomentosiformis TaxID=4098 RepID=UPI00388C9554
MTRNFLDKYFSSAKTGKFKIEIHNFCQKETKTIFEACERFKEIVRKCQHSGIELWMQLQEFWEGLTSASHRTLSNVVGGNLMKKTPKKIVTILDELSDDTNQWPSKSAKRRRSIGVHQVDSNTSVQVQLDAMAKEIRKLTLAKYKVIHMQCVIYVFFVEFTWGTANAWKQNNPRPQRQGAPGFMNHQRQQFQPQQAIQSGIEDLMKAFILKTDERLETHSAAIREHGAAIKELGTDFRNLERQVGELATLLSERIPGTLPADTERNPKETLNVVTLRSEKVLKDLTPIKKDARLEKKVGCS